LLNSNLILKIQLFTYSRVSEFYTVSVPYRTVPQRFFTYHDLTLEKLLFRREKRTVFRFLCISAWLTAAAFSVFIFSANCTVKALKCVPFIIKNSAKWTIPNTKPFSVIILKRETYRGIFLTVFRLLTQKTEILPFVGAVRLALLKYKRKMFQNIITIRFALLK